MAREQGAYKYDVSRGAFRYTAAKHRHHAGGYAMNEGTAYGKRREVRSAFEAKQDMPNRAKGVQIKATQNKVSEKFTKFVIACFAIVFFSVIGISAISTKISYDNSNLARENVKLKSELQSSKSSLQSSINLEKIKNNAQVMLGMVDLDGEQYVFLNTSSATTTENFADMLKAQAFK